MKKYTYLGIFEPTKTGYSVYFPDLVGCISYGDTFDIAQEQAKDALSLHIYGMLEDNENLPISTLIIDIDKDTSKGYLIAPITIFL